MYRSLEWGAESTVLDCYWPKQDDGDTNHGNDCTIKGIDVSWRVDFEVRERANLNGPLTRLKDALHSSRLH